jgi:hypothetical protein
MRLNESTIRRIIKEEAKRVIREGHEEGGHSMGGPKDPVGFLEMHMTHIEDLFKGGYDPDDAMDEASGMIDDLCFDLNNVMHEWLMDYLKDNEMDRAEYANDMEDDRRMHAGEDNDR